MEPPAPDLSHLTEEERRIIENVMARQREEEDKEREVFKKKQDEVKLLETAIRLRSEERHRKEGTGNLEATCEICLKTKFADGVGHICNYCNIRCCARCGGKVSLRSNKVIWVCILCRKKQELVIKTGQWVQSGNSHSKGTPGQSPYGPDSSNKAAKLERARSLDKENTHPLPGTPSGRRGSLQRQSSHPGRHPGGDFRRQYSHESERALRISPTDSSSRPDRGYYESQGDRHSDRGRPMSDRSPSSDTKRIRSPGDVMENVRDEARHHREGSERNRHQYREGTRSREPSPDPHGRHSRDRTREPPPTIREPSGERHRDRRTSWEYGRRDDMVHSDGGSRDPPRHRERLRSDDGMSRSREPSMERRPSREPSRDRDSRCRRESSLSRHGNRSEERRDRIPGSAVGSPEVSDLRYRSPSSVRIALEDDRRTHLDPGSVADSWPEKGLVNNNSNNRRKSESVVRNDSLSSDQSENVRPPPPPPKHRQKRGKKLRQRSFSSSDDEIRSTPEYSSCEEQEIESESVSEKACSPTLKLRPQDC